MPLHMVCSATLGSHRDSTSATSASLASCGHLSQPPEWGSKYAFLLYELPSLWYCYNNREWTKTLPAGTVSTTGLMESSSPFSLYCSTGFSLHHPQTTHSMALVFPILEGKPTSLPSCCVHGTLEHMAHSRCSMSTR